MPSEFWRWVWCLFSVLLGPVLDGVSHGMAAGVGVLRWCWVGLWSWSSQFGVWVCLVSDWCFEVLCVDLKVIWFGFMILELFLLQILMFDIGVFWSMNSRWWGGEEFAGGLAQYRWRLGVFCWLLMKSPPSCGCAWGVLSCFCRNPTLRLSSGAFGFLCLCSWKVDDGGVFGSSWWGMLSRWPSGVLDLFLALLIGVFSGFFLWSGNQF
ncbi:unnamed protein product [Amaranthus hypochondriacus]